MLNIGLFQFSSQISVTLVSVLFTPPLVNPIYQQLSRYRMFYLLVLYVFSSGVFISGHKLILIFEGREVKKFNNRNYDVYEFLMFCTVPPCPLCLPQPLLWPWRPGSGHGSHAGGGGSRRSGGGALVPILVPVVGLVQVAVLLLLLVAVGAALLLLLVAVGVAQLGRGQCCSCCWRQMVGGSNVSSGGGRGGGCVKGRGVGGCTSSSD